MTKKQFDKLPENLKRVAVAKDVRYRLRRKQYTARPQYYASVPGLFTEKNEGKQLQKVLKTTTKECTVCALGGLFLSQIRLANDCLVDDDLRDSHYTKSSISSCAVHERVANIFGEERHIIEVAFEGSDRSGDLEDYCVNNLLNYDDLYNDCEMFYEKYPDNKERLLAIMENIIRHNGEFTPVVKVIDG